MPALHGHRGRAAVALHRDRTIGRYITRISPREKRDIQCHARRESKPAYETQNANNAEHLARIDASSHIAPPLPPVTVISSAIECVKANSLTATTSSSAKNSFELRVLFCSVLPACQKNKAGVCIEIM